MTEICNNMSVNRDNMQITIIFHIVRLIITLIRGITNEACSHWCWLIGLEPSLQQHSVSDSSDNVCLVTLAAFHGHIDFCPTLQIIAGCCEIYPPRPAGRSYCSVDTRVAIWFKECDILQSHWLPLTSVYFLSMVWLYLTAYQETCFHAC